MTQTFTLSIEPTGEPAYQHGFHLGTDETIARLCAEEIFISRNNSGKPTCTVALMRDGRIVDVYDGKWLQSPMVEINQRSEHDWSVYVDGDYKGTVSQIGQQFVCTHSGGRYPTREKAIEFLVERVG